MQQHQNQQQNYNNYIILFAFELLQKNKNVKSKNICLFIAALYNTITNNTNTNKAFGV